MTLLSGAVWAEIRRVSKSSETRYCAVPYFGRGATELLHLRAGAILVIRFDMEAVKSGQVDPREVLKSIRAGVSVYSCSNLHAKVFVFDQMVIVGSANATRHSERHLIEACVKTTERRVVAEAVRFVKSLIGVRVGPELAKRMIPFWRPPRFPPSTLKSRPTRTRVPRHAGLWLVSLVERAWAEIDYVHQAKGLPAARKALKNDRSSEIEDFQWSGRNRSRFRVGQRVVQCTRTGDGTVLVSPPRTIVHVRRYTVRGKPRAIVYLEVLNAQRRRQLTSVMRQLGSAASHLGNPRRTKQIRNPELVHAIGRLWM